MKINYEEIKSYHDKGLLDSMRLSLGLPWSQLVATMFEHVDNLQEELDATNNELSEIEAEIDDRGKELEYCDDKIENIQYELVDLKEENASMRDYITELEASVE